MPADNTIITKNTGHIEQQPTGNRELNIPIPIVAAGITVVGAIGVAILVHYFSRQREAVARFSAAAKDFRNAFANELAILESGEKLPTHIKEFLLDAYEERHKVAIATFEHFLHESDRLAFKAACKKYHSNNKSICNEVGFSHREALFSEYMVAEFDDSGINPCKLAAQRIRELLEFAKHK
jgi:hypothetical protein